MQRPQPVSTAFKIASVTADVNLFNEIPFLMRLAKHAMRLGPFALPGAVLAGYYVYPALTEEYKQEWGLPNNAPKVEE